MERGWDLRFIPQDMSDANQKLPTREQIERRAHQIYVERGCRDGNEQADWLAAEKELTQLASEQDKPAIPISSNDQQKCRPTSMFLDYYGLKEQPFGMTPDPAYLYASRTHSAALASLSIGIDDNRGFLALIAKPGMGKTTLLYQLLEDLRDSTRTVLVSQTQCTSRELIEYILYDLGVDVKGMGLVAMHGQLNEILFEELLAGKRFVLVVDEAQNLDDSVLETVRMLSNFETHNAKLLQIILAGQPGLAAKLAQPQLSQLRQRISVLSHLEPFTTVEAGLYIEHRLKVAGSRGEPIFDSGSIALIARQSQGIPREINNLCYHSLFLSYSRGLRTVTAKIAQEAMESLDLESLAPAPAVVAAASGASVATTSVAKAPEPSSAPIPAPNNKDRRSNSFLTYDADSKPRPPQWPVRSALVVIILLSGTMLLTILGRSESKQRLTPATFGSSSSALGPLIPAERSEVTAASYDAAPQDTGDGQVLTVVVGPQENVKDLSLKYAGHFDSNLSNKIFSLNPDLKDSDHLVAGQLIRIPLPPGAMRKVNDTAETANPNSAEPSGSLLTRFTAFLRARK
jgi:type II secretory pathway predicted ATPase ExeA